jgi:hypothetical protein
MAGWPARLAGGSRRLDRREGRSLEQHHRRRAAGLLPGTVAGDSTQASRFVSSARGSRVANSVGQHQVSRTGADRARGRRRRLTRLRRSAVSASWGRSVLPVPAVAPGRARNDPMGLADIRTRHAGLPAHRARRADPGRGRTPHRTRYHREPPRSRQTPDRPQPIRLPRTLRPWASGIKRTPRRAVTCEQLRRLNPDAPAKAELAPSSSRR